MNRILYTLIALVFTLDTIAEISVIPAPLSVKENGETYHWGTNMKIGFDRILKNEAEYLQSILTEKGIQSFLASDTKGKKEIVLELTPEIKGKEAYILTSSSKSIHISASSPTGIFYGIQTLRQLIRIDNKQLTIPGVSIQDEPAFSWRAFMLDECRHFKGKECVKLLLDQMALLKMNTFHWHLTDDQGWRIEIKKYPELTRIGAFRDSTQLENSHSNNYLHEPHGGFYTQKEIKEIIRYAEHLHIRVIPEIEMPGHAGAAIAAYTWLGCTGKRISVPCKFGVNYDILDVTNPKVYSFIENILDEIIALFPSPIIHIGGDEVKYNQWKASPTITQYMEKNKIKNPAELQVDFTNKISRMLSQKGKRMIGWNDITGDKIHNFQAEEETGSNAQLAPGTIVQFWKGDSTLIRKTLEKGFDIVNSYHIYTYLDYTYKKAPLEKAYSFSPIPENIPTELKKHILGLGCQMWTEWLPTCESAQKMIFPRIAAHAETGWTAPENKNFYRFSKTLPALLEYWDNIGIKYGNFK
ncbi:beta-N-acetylhexosaminidase [Coprobacter sp.]